MTNSALFLVVLLAALVLVVAALLIAKFISPHSNNALKGEPYECGIPTRGNSWVQFRSGYYLFAILFLVFDVETVMLFPWAVITKNAGMQGLVCVLFFLIVLTLGLAYAWKKGVLVWK
ncbi:NADH-quinone oxidoreductase subunit A [Bacteroidia bacterium]|nr:NADH-quinone oxidoreductase subunit A [Bacteroidia bacterium]